MSKVEEQRAAICVEALSWLGTPYIHGGDIKGAGTDCAMLLRCVYVNCGIVAPFDPRPYPPEWHLHQNEERFLAYLERFSKRVERPEAADVIAYKIGKVVSHGGILLPKDYVVHSDIRVGKVCRFERRAMAKREHSYWRVVEA